MIFSNFVFAIFFSFSCWGQAPSAVVKKAPVVDVKKLKADDTTGRRQFSDDELQQKFFNNKSVSKKSSTESTKLFLPVFYERMENPLARIQARGFGQLTGLVNLEIDGSAMIAILNELVEKKALQKFSSVADECQKLSGTKDGVAVATENVCWTNIDRFKDSEVLVEFSEQRLEIRIRIPAELRTKKISSLLRYGSANFDEVTNEPSFFSSYLNFNMSQDFRSDIINLKNGRQPLAGQYDSGTRIGDVVVEAKARSIEKRREIPSSDPAFIREDVRVVTDFSSLGQRAQVGDLTYPVRGFQTFRPMAGASLFTQLSLQSSQLTLPTGNYELFLKRPSKIAIFINDQLIQTLALPAGRHNLRDFPFVVGLNDLKLEITDDLGIIEVQNYSYFSSNELLKLGQNEISYSVGAPWTETAGLRIYDSDKLTFSAFHRYGFTQSLSLGAHLQADPFQTVAGFEFLFSTKLGYFSIEPAYSINQDAPSGYAARLRYIVQDSTEKDKNTQFTSFEVGGFSDDFAPLGVRKPINPLNAKFQATHSRALSKTANVNLSLGYNFNRVLSNKTTDAYSLSVGGTKRWFDGFSSNVSFRHTRNAVNIEEISVLLFIVWAFPKERQFVTASTESASGTSRADWTYQPTAGVGGFTSRVNVQEKQKGSAYGESIDYVGNRGRLSQSHQVDVIDEDRSQNPFVPKRSVHATNLQAASAIVFAGGRFALSRPVTDSFAMLIPLENLKEQNVLVNPQKDGSYLAGTDWLGTAVVPELPSYSLTTIVLGQKDLKQSVSLPQDHFDLKPGYRSGYAIYIGTDANIYLKTKLINEQSEPVSLVAAQVIYLDDLKKDQVTVFTNRSGLLRSEGFRAGRYRLEVTDSDYEPFEFTIPENTPAEFELPPLQLKARKK